jgi:hypothetical protein
MNRAAFVLCAEHRAPAGSGFGEEGVDDGGEVGGFCHEGEVAASVEV